MGQGSTPLVEPSHRRNMNNTNRRKNVTILFNCSACVPFVWCLRIVGCCAWHSEYGKHLWCAHEHEHRHCRRLTCSQPTYSFGFWRTYRYFFLPGFIINSYYYCCFLLCDNYNVCTVQKVNCGLC